jgi:hypothetical protein
LYVLNKVFLLEEKQNIIDNMVSTTVYLIIIVAISVAVGIALATYTKPIFSTSCFSNFDCEWKIANCCPETAGARWECVNKKTFQEPNCQRVILCPQVISPKPESDCVCVSGSCVVE